MFFVHPQLKFTKGNIIKILKAFLAPSDYQGLGKKLSFFLPQKQFILTDMGRTAFRLLLKKLNIRDCQIIMPAYICDIFYPVLKEFNIAPIFLDIDLNTFNVSPEQIKQKINPQVKAILISHTYGLTNDMAKIYNQLSTINNKLLIIEDFAHTFGAKQNGKYLGNLGDVAFCSLYKQFPTLRGGLAVFPKEPDLTNLAYARFVKRLPSTRFGLRDLFSLLNYFPFFSFLFKKFGSDIAPKFQRKEKRQQPSLLNRVSLNLFSLFWNDLEKNLEKRIALALHFREKLKELGFSVQETKNNIFTFLSAMVPERLTDKRDQIVEKLRKHKVFCTRIWHTPIILNLNVQKEYGISPAQFPNTVIAAKRIINFPLQNHYAKNDINKMLKALKLVLDKVRT